MGSFPGCQQDRDHETIKRRYSCALTRNRGRPEDHRAALEQSAKPGLDLRRKRLLHLQLAAQRTRASRRFSRPCQYLMGAEGREHAVGRTFTGWTIRSDDLLRP